MSKAALLEGAGNKQSSRTLYVILVLLMCLVAASTITSAAFIWKVYARLDNSEGVEQSSLVVAAGSLQDSVAEVLPYDDVETVAKGDISPYKEKFSFEDIFSADFRYRSFSAAWYRREDEGQEVDIMVYKHNGAVVYEKAEDEAKHTLIPEAAFSSLDGASRYFLNSDLSMALLAYDEKKNWRHSFDAQYTIYNTSMASDDTVGYIEFPNGDEFRGKRLQDASWAPTGRGLAFVYNNDMYYQADIDADPVRLTNDGDLTIKFNGIPDWVYEEDVISSRRANHFSDTGRYLLYVSIDDTDIPLEEYSIHGQKEEMFTTIRKIAYPKAGYFNQDGSLGPIPKVTLRVYDTEGTGSTSIDLPVPAEVGTEYYYTRVSWYDDRVLVTWVNRIQTKAVVMLCDPAITDTSSMCMKHYERIQKDGWIDAPWPAPVYNEDKSAYFTYFPHTVDAESTWRMPAKVETKENAEAQFLWETSKNEIASIVKYDPTRQLVYVYSTHAEQKNRKLYQLPAAGGDPTCLSCDECDYVSASFSQSGDYYIRGCLADNKLSQMPKFDLVKLDATGKVERVVRVLEDNSALKQRVDGKQMADRQMRLINLPNIKDANAEILVPPSIGATEKLPLLIFAYAGPGSQRVTTKIPLGSLTSNWLQHLVSEYRFVVASVDGRGSSGRGEENRFEVYKRIGTVEMDDQAAFAQELVKTYSYIDPTFVSAFGWSYGGFAASQLLSRPDQIFSCGIAVAPVTSKRYYDTAYTERYLSTADVNELGYNGTDVMARVENMRNKQYFIAHGTDDDNVHFRHAAMMIKELTEAGIEFQEQTYIDQDHSIRDPPKSRHLYKSMTSFLTNRCMPEAPVDSGSVPAHHLPRGATYLLISLLLVAVSRN